MELQDLGARHIRICIETVASAACCLFTTRLEQATQTIACSKPQAGKSPCLHAPDKHIMHVCVVVARSTAVLQNQRRPKPGQPRRSSSTVVNRPAAEASLQHRHVRIKSFGTKHTLAGWALVNADADMVHALLSLMALPLWQHSLSLPGREGSHHMYVHTNRVAGVTFTRCANP
jgi:hypothetical protein